MSVIRKWWFSLLLGLLYVAVFLTWHDVGRRVVLVSGMVTSAIMIGCWLFAARQRYFCNRVDALLHGVVILDVLLEGLLVSSHHSRSFYFCALAFAAVIGGYRQHRRVNLASATDTLATKGSADL